MNNATNETWRSLVERIYNANQKRDYALYELLLKPHPLGTSRRERIDAELRLLVAEHRAGNPPCYFR